MDISTTYLGLTLKHPFMVGASPLGAHIDTVRRLEDAGSSAIVLPSIFEEQISMAQGGKIHHMDPLDAEFAELLAPFPSPERYPLSPDAYLEHLRRVKAAVHVPVIASLNGMTKEPWLAFARMLEQAGADAIELNMYGLATEATEPAAAVEARIRNTVVELKRHLHVPLAVKLLPFFTAFGHFAHALDDARADGLVLFNRFYEPDIDEGSMTFVPRIVLSTNHELPLRLHWTAILHGRVRCSLAITGGVETAADGVKAILAGAHAVQLVSAILRSGAGYIGVMRDGLTAWMHAHAMDSLERIRGRVEALGATDLTERANYLNTLLQTGRTP